MREKTRISPIGKSNRGFSLVELVVVFALIGLMLVFAIPRFQQKLLPEDSRKVARWIMAHTAAARTRAVAEQTQFILNVGISENRLWITDKAMSEEAALAAKEKALVLNENVRIRKVEYPGKTAVVSGIAEISFYSDGHADPAWIQLKDTTEAPVFLFIEPFLPRVRYQDAKVE